MALTDFFFPFKPRPEDEQGHMVVQANVDELIKALQAEVATLSYSEGSTGWIDFPTTLAYSSADSPTFVATPGADPTSYITPGTRIRLTQTSVKYFIVTAVSATTVTLYGGTDYTLANAAISAISFSPFKAPVGFPLNPLKWTVRAIDNARRTQTSPVIGTWYNLGPNSISVPIGAWRLGYEKVMIALKQSAGDTGVNVFATLSTANNSESDTDFTAYAEMEVNMAGNTFMVCTDQVKKEKTVLLSSKTTYYSNSKTTYGTMYLIGEANELSNLIITAVCAYL